MKNFLKISVKLPARNFNKKLFINVTDFSEFFQNWFIGPVSQYLFKILLKLLQNFFKVVTQIATDS